MKINFFTAMKVGYVIITGIKEAAKDKHITHDEAIRILKKVLKVVGVSVIGGL